MGRGSASREGPGELDAGQPNRTLWLTPGRHLRQESWDEAPALDSGLSEALAAAFDLI